MMWAAHYPRLTDEQRRLRAAHRLKRLAPLSYRKAVRKGRLPRV